MTAPSHQIETVRRAFGLAFGAGARPPRLFWAPGRINLIGEHTDYSEGFVMPAAIHLGCLVAVAPNGSDDLRVLSLNRNELVALPSAFERRNAWSDYVAGVRAALAEAGIAVPGCDIALHSEVMEGAGISSSAALEVSVALALLAVAGHNASQLDVARWAQRAEAHYVGMPCGLMDQFASVHGRAGHAMKLDCRSLQADFTPIPARAALVLIDSQVRHQLTDGGYAARRADCEEAAAKLGVRVLRDATPEILAASGLPDRLMRRARHVVEENARVLSAASALKRGGLDELGRLMSASHASLRDLFNVTCPETDALVSIARATAGVLGARQMGGGFGGAVLVLTEAASADAVRASILESYGRVTSRQTSGLVCHVGQGAHEVSGGSLA